MSDACWKIVENVELEAILNFVKVISVTYHVIRLGESLVYIALAPFHSLAINILHSSPVLTEMRPCLPLWIHD